MAVVLITGCSSGFGRAAALAFAARGDLVVATMRNTGRADGLGDIERITVDQLDIVDAESRWRRRPHARSVRPHRRARQQRRRVGARTGRGDPRAGHARPVRDQFLRPVRADPRAAAVDARQPHRSHRQRDVDRRRHDVRLLQRLLRHQARDGCDLARPRHRAATLRHPCGDGGAGRVHDLDGLEPDRHPTARHALPAVRDRRWRSTRAGCLARRTSRR